MGDRPVPAKPPAPGDPVSEAKANTADSGGANADGAGEPQPGDGPRHAKPQPQTGDRTRHALGMGKAEQEEIR